MHKNIVFTKFILKQIAGTVAYNSVSHSFQLSIRTLSNSIRKAIYEEGKKWEMSNQTIDDYISRVYNEIELSYQPIKQSIQFIDVTKDIKQGLQIMLEGHDNTRGLAKLSLLYLGISRRDKQPCFMVLRSSRLSLIIEDILEPADNTLWSIGHPVLFKVFRNGERYPNSESVYRTFKIEDIVLVKPSVIHEIIDAKSDFTYLENSLSQIGNTLNGTISFGKNPMTLLMHNFSSNMPIYANFDDEGVGRFSSNPNILFQSSEIRNKLFGIVDDGYLEKDLKIATIEEGEVYYDSANKTIVPKKTAKGKLKVLH